MNHDPKLFPEPDKFVPERYLNNTKTMMAAANGKIDYRDHFTFGWGRRICPGIHLVLNNVCDTNWAKLIYLFIFCFRPRYNCLTCSYASFQNAK